MKAVLQVFEHRILNEFLPTLFNDQCGLWKDNCFNDDCQKIHEVDAFDFLRGIDSGLVTHAGRGLYTARRGNGHRLFNSGRGTKKPREVTLNVEAIIIIAALARLHFDLGWPPESLGTETQDLAFDAATYLSTDSQVEHIACEVKKSTVELEQLFELMTRFGRDPSDKPTREQEKNAFRKTQALRSRRPPLFWAVGPGELNYAFGMGYAEDGLVRFDETPVQELSYQGASGQECELRRRVF